MNYTTSTPSPTRLTEEFTLKQATLYGGANLYIDYLQGLGLKEMFANHVDIQKADYSTYTIADSLMHLVLGYSLGKDAILQFEDLENDALLTQKMGLEKMPDYSLLYGELERFQEPEHSNGLHEVNTEVCSRVLPTDVVLDFDSSVTTVYGTQGRADTGYNQNKPGRKSYHPLFCFEAQTGLCLNATLRRGSSTNSPDFARFLQETQTNLPEETRIRYVRFDSGFAGEDVYGPLEKDGIGYVGKIKKTDRLMKHAESFGYRRVEHTDLTIEVKSFNYQATTWQRRRRVVIVRTRDPNTKQLHLGDYGWDVRVMVTNLDWDGLDIWRFYNHRCNAENHIKELRYGFAMDRNSQQGYHSNDANLLLKVIAYNCYIAYRLEVAEQPLEKLTIERMRRYVFRIPAVIRNHARGLILRLSEDFRFQEVYMQMRRNLEGLGFT